MTELLFFVLGGIIGLLSGITIIFSYILKRISDNSFIELPRLKNEKKNN